MSRNNQKCPASGPQKQFLARKRHEKRKEGKAIKDLKNELLWAESQLLMNTNLNKYKE